jgi:5-methylcytosine-specific restriction enzyme subunit McrC
MIPSFFVRMERVFERALFHAFEDSDAERVRHEPLYTPFSLVAGAPALTITIKPDIVVGPRLHPVLVADAKWSPPLEMHQGVMTYRNNHVYQLVTYCHALRCPGLLVYPRYNSDVAVSYELDGVRVAIRTVDLSVPKLAGLRELVDDVFGALTPAKPTAAAA